MKWYSPKSDMQILVTGAQGFIGRNLTVRLGEISDYQIDIFARSHTLDDLAAKVAAADAVIHLAGENRPVDVADFAKVNTDLTAQLCQLIARQGRPIPLVLASSAQAVLDNPYGSSKRGGELAAEALADTGNPVVIYRLPGVFGKWGRPNYNSVVATFCHHLARDLPIQISDPNRVLQLVYVDDVVESFLQVLKSPQAGLQREQVSPEYTITLGALADQIRAFQYCRHSLVIERVGTGLVRALYATYVSYLPTERFVYDVPAHRDHRGAFVEMLKTPDAGQFSFFTSAPGITRGSHYHHTKTEKFLVVKGQARFGFRHILSNETHEVLVSGDQPQIVETVPGWTHDVTNVGSDELIVMLWANENFDRERPDTVPCKV